MSKSSWDKFWEWNKRVLSDDRPALAFSEQVDDDGNKEGFVWFLGSYFYYNSKSERRMDMPRMIGQLNALHSLPHPQDRRKLMHDAEEEDEEEDW